MKKVPEDVDEDVEKIAEKDKLVEKKEIEKAKEKHEDAPDAYRGPEPGTGKKPSK